MAEENPDTARSLAERIRQLSRHHQENLGSNPRYWRRSFSRANRRIAVKEATLRRLLYNSGEPKVRPKTRRKLLRVIKALERMIQNQGEEKPDSDKEQRVNNAPGPRAGAAARRERTTAQGGTAERRRRSDAGRAAGSRSAS